MQRRLRTMVGASGFGDLLGNRTFLRMFTGRVVTDVGDSLYYVGSMWLIWELTGSPLYTGLAGGLLRVPNVLSFLVGPLVDRWRLRRVLLGTQVINFFGVLIVPVAAVTGNLSVWLLLVLMPMLDFVNSFVYPAQNAALPRIVTDERLTKANSLFSTTIRTVDSFANAAAGALISLVGAVALFVVDAGTFAVAAALFVGVTVEEAQDGAATGPGDDTTDRGDGTETSVFRGLKVYLVRLREGLAYVQGSALLAMLGGMMVANFVLVAASAVLPAFADAIAGPTAYGLLVAAMAAGNVVGAAAASLVEERAVSAVGLFGHLLGGATWVAAVVVPGLWPTVVLLFAASIPVGTFNVIFGAMYQSAVDDALLGRISALTTTLGSLMTPLGSLLGGAVGESVGSAVVMLGVGAVVALVGACYRVHPTLRSLPPVAEADEAALALSESTGTED